MILVVWPLRFLHTAGLAGPIFDKELRVASRRRRNYALRFVYVVTLLLFIATVWIDTVRFRGLTAVQQTQMEMAAKRLTVGIVWFQFLAAQIVAVITMSTAISDEVYGRTLGVLMTTPLSSFQVVMGKLFSRLLQILLLVATTLPLLAVIRVLGGIPWNYLLWSLLTTWVAVVFAGSVSLFFSALCRRAYAVIIAGALSIGFVFAFVPFLTLIILSRQGFDDDFLLLFRYVNPYVLLTYCTDYMLSPARGAAVPTASLIVCSVFLLLGSVGLLHASVRLVYQVALRHATGEMTFLDYLCRRRPTDRADEQGKMRDHGVRRVVGPPMIWKELTCALSRRQRLAARLAVGTEILLVLIAYTFPPMMEVVSYEGVHVLYLWFFLGLGALFTLSVSATVISSERESGAWPLLLVAPLRDRDILVGKSVGVLRRCGPIWLPLLAYIVAFTLADCFRPLAIVQMAAVMVSVIVFLSATGFYFGSRCKRTAEAVTANLVLAGILWGIGPLIAQWIAELSGVRWHNGESFAGVPFAQVALLLSTTLDGMRGYYRWSGHRVGAWGATSFMLVSMVVHTLAASFFVWRAMRAFRRRII
jgi:ABC-type transport system involved in multi-copper enzyme maturation permease subunit